MRLLNIGSRGPDVAKVQRYISEKADGIYGPKTYEAVRRWRWRVGAPGDTGAIGPVGQRIMFREIPRPPDWIARTRARKGSVPKSGLIYTALPPILYLPTPNLSTRHSTSINGAVAHETEGSYAGAVSWLRSPRSRASAHVVLRDDGGHATQLVPWTEKAWHAANANPHTLGLEIVGWTAKPNKIEQLRVAARIMAFWAEEFGFPVRQGNRYGHGGIVRHRDLGAFGGGHGDPGGFDWTWFLRQVAIERERGNFPGRWGVSS